jgi:hypothetical protein
MKLGEHVDFSTRIRIGAEDLHVEGALDHAGGARRGIHVLVINGNHSDQ